MNQQSRREEIQNNYLNIDYESSWGCFKRKTNKVAGKREVYIGVQDEKVVDNRIETSKYNLFTFLPKNLYVQFSKLANIYFIIVGICQIIPSISTTNGQPLVYFPLSIVVIISMIKDIIEDRKRKIQDEYENLSMTNKYCHNTKQFISAHWQTLRIGDIIKVNEEEKFPADILILSTSLPKVIKQLEQCIQIYYDQGVCHIETKNLDGETNLKYRQSCSSKLFQNEMDLTSDLNCGKFSITYEDPNCNIHNFSGYLADHNQSQNETNTSSNRFQIGVQNTCFRGCLLKRTHWITGVVIYTGHDCKSLKYASSPKYKFGTVEKKMNNMVCQIFAILMFISTFCAIYYTVWYSNHEEELNYLQIPQDTKKGVIFIIHIPMWLLLLNTFVPISLLVTLEIVKYLQGQLIQKDSNFKGADNKPEPIEVNGSNLLDELGTVRYILTDKTGTLTCNVMKFKAISLSGQVYEHEKYEDSDVLYSEEIISLLKDPKNHELVFEAFLCMNICHSLIIEEKNGKKVYLGTSADEECIMEFCVLNGLYYEGINENKVMTIFNSNNNRRYQFRVIAIREYHSSLGKMSILIEDLQTKTFKMYTKGSSNKIFASLKQDQEEMRKVTEKHIDKFGESILRTLCLSYRYVSCEEVQNLIEKEKNMTQKGEHLDVFAIQDQLFKDIDGEQILLGGTGVNDEFADEVQSTLINLMKAGIKVWMITGDKRETALSVAVKCGILDKGMILQMIDIWHNQDMKTLEEEVLECLSLADKSQKFSLGISGIALAKILSVKDSMLEINLKKAMSYADSIVAFHFSPMQKAELVQILKQMQPQCTILSIGDGANDVSMIQASHVGVGIRGKEGREAAKSADFSIAEFKHLNRLLLYIGQEAYRKNTNLIFYNFYKNQAWNLVYFWYNISSNYSGAFVYDQWISQLYNLLFVSSPIIIYALFDEIHSSNEYFSFIQTKPNYLEKIPYSYRANSYSPSFTYINFWKWFLHGSFHSLIVVCAAFLCFASNSDEKQRPIQIFAQGMHAYASCVIIGNLKVMQLHYTHYPLSLAMIFISIALYPIVMSIASNINTFDSAGVFEPLFGIANSYYGFCLVIIITYGFDSSYTIYSKQIYKIEEVKKPVDQTGIQFTVFNEISNKTSQVDNYDLNTTLDSSNSSKHKQTMNVYLHKQLLDHSSQNGSIDKVTQIDKTSEKNTFEVSVIEKQQNSVSASENLKEKAFQPNKSLSPQLSFKSVQEQSHF